MNRTIVKTQCRMLVVLAINALLIGNASAATIWDRITAFTTGMKVLQPFAIWLCLIAGLFCMFFCGWTIFKLSKPNGRGDNSWGEVGGYFLAGIVLIGIVAFTDIGVQTVLGTNAVSTVTP